MTRYYRHCKKTAIGCWATCYEKFWEIEMGKKEGDVAFRPLQTGNF